MPRWITVKPTAVPFDYRWPDATAITAFTAAGEFFVKDQIADWAVAKGHATEGRRKGSTARSTKGKSTPTRKRATKGVDGAPTGPRNNDAVVRAHHADDDTSARQRPVDPDSDQRQ